MSTIGQIFAKPIDRKIEEVIKVDQADEATVRDELAEYIATEAIREHFATLYKAIADSASEPHEGVGAWVSGFFGSGKSSFAKILGYTLDTGRTVGGRRATELFLDNVRDVRLAELLAWLNQRLPTHVVMFDVAKDRGLRTASERITQLMYQAFLRELDYSEDFDLAELEMRLDHDGQLAQFEALFEREFRQPWKKRRQLGAGINEASRILNLLDPKTYPHADSWARAPKRADVDATEFARRVFELMARRKPGHALLFVIDEVGQYIARSVDKMLDLQAVVEAFGVAGKQAVKERRAPAPCWIVVTSQEKLDEVVDALGSRKVELARVQARFPQEYWVDLKSTDISEVASRRVLEKNAAGREALEQLFEANKGRLRAFCSLERTGRNTAIAAADFVQLYPYLPYQIDLCIDIVAGLRLRRGAQRHIGGSMRTMIKQAQQMLIHPRTRLADQPLGTLVTLDRVYDLLYLGHLLPSEVTREVEDVASRLPGNDIALKVAKAVSLLEAVKDPARTAPNLAVVLHPHVAAEPIREQVEAALKELERVQIVRQTDEGYKLLTVHEKGWDTKRDELSPRPADRVRLLRELLGRVFADGKIKSFRYKSLQTFKLRLLVDGDPVEGDGQVAMNALPAADQDDWPERCREARVASNQQRDRLFWVFRVYEGIHRQLEQLYRSREMIAAHERLAAQGKLAPEESSCLTEEKFRLDRIDRDLMGRLVEALMDGTGFFQAVQYDSSALGATLPDILHGLLANAIPLLYPKFEMGVRPGLTGAEAEKFLTAANLNGLPELFKEGGGLALVVKQGARWVPNPAAPVCKEVFDFLKTRHAYGDRVTGKLLEEHFQGLGYGWDRDVLRLVLAVLLRGGAIEVTHQGRKYRNHAESACRQVFTNQPAFRAASFAPRELLGLKTLTAVSQLYEDMTGQEVDVEEGAIAEAFGKLAQEDRERLLPVLACVEALGLPGVETLTEYRQMLEGLLEMAPDDCVKTLASEGKSFRQGRERLARLAEATAPDRLPLLRQAKRVLEGQWPAVRGLPAAEALADTAAELGSRLASEDFAQDIPALQRAAGELAAAYAGHYQAVHDRRGKLYADALDAVKGLAEWAKLTTGDAPRLSPQEQQALLAPLADRASLLAPDGRILAGHAPELPAGEEICQVCRASLREMEADLLTVEVHKAQVIAAVQELAPLPEGDEGVERVRSSEFLRPFYDREQVAEMEADLDAFKQRLRTLLTGEGVERVVLE